ncbi:MAG: non-canonical purine NTP pyrophosphatase [Candidatus Paceibacterota bacterium]
MKITFVTGNLGKVKEVSRYLGIPLNHQSLDLAEIQSLDLEEIVKDKAARAFSAIGQPLLVEDVSLVFHALGKLPGPLVKWFLDQLDNEGLCHLVDGKERGCTATVCYGLHDGKSIHLFSGSMEGFVASQPKGNNSFGWAPIFLPAGFDKTYAELTDEEQAPIAMRNKALKKLRDFLEK